MPLYVSACVVVTNRRVAATAAARGELLGDWLPRRIRLSSAASAGTAQAMVILGGGYAVPVLEPLGWLAGIDVVYWGDIDTHGFAILDRLRQHLPHARSMLMDRATLLGHREHWTTEPSPTAAALSRLDRAESALYADLISNAYAPSVRLEQERIRFSAVEKQSPRWWSLPPVPRPDNVLR